MEHCIVILPRDNPVCFSIETDHGVFDFSGLQQIPNCSQEIPNNMKATHAQDKLLLEHYNLLLDPLLPPLEVILYRYFEVLLFRCIFIFVWHLFRW